MGSWERCVSGKKLLGCRPQNYAGRISIDYVLLLRQCLLGVQGSECKAGQSETRKGERGKEKEKRKRERRKDGKKEKEGKANKSFPVHTTMKSCREKKSDDEVKLVFGKT